MKKFLCFFILLMIFFNKTNNIKVCAYNNLTDNFVLANVVDENVKSEVYLTFNEYSESELFKSNIKIVIKTNGEIIEILTDNLSGYNPRIFLGDFLGNGLNQIMLSVDTSINCQNTIVYVYEINKGKPNIIFNPETYNLENNFIITPENSYLKISDNNSNYLLELNNKNNSYIVSNISKALPYYNTQQKKYDLVVFNNIVNSSNSEIVGSIISFVNLYDGKIKLLNRGVISGVF